MTELAHAGRVCVCVCVCVLEGDGADKSVILRSDKCIML